MQAMFGPRIQLEIYQSNAASAQDTFCHSQKLKKKNEEMEQSGLTIVTGENCVLLNTRMDTWLLLTIFTCLHNQLSSIHSIVTY